MKKLLFVVGLALTLVYCNTPQPTGSPDGTDTTGTNMNTNTNTGMGTDTTMRDTTNMR